MNKSIILIVCCSFLSLTSCDNMFKEDGGVKGYISATLDNGQKVIPLATEAFQVRYYDNFSGLEYNEKLGDPDYFSSGNKFLSYLPIGNYKFLSYNILNNRIRNAGNLESIEIYSDTIFSNKWGVSIIKNEQNKIFMSSSQGKILREDTTNIDFPLIPMVQKIQFNVILKGIAVSTERISSIQALLTGVITARKIYTNQPQAKYAGQIFNFINAGDSKYTSSAYVFGISNQTNNKLKLELIGDTFQQYTEVDLSSVLTDFTSEGMVIDVVVEIGENMEMNNIYIEGWKNISQGNINF